MLTRSVDAVEAPSPAKAEKAEETARTTEAKRPAPPSLIPLTLPFLSVILFVLPLLTILLREPDYLSDWRKVALTYLAEVTMAMSFGLVAIPAYAWLLPRLFVRVKHKLLRLLVHVGTIAVTVVLGIQIGGQVNCFTGQYVWVPPEPRPFEQLFALVVVIIVLAIGLQVERTRRHTRAIERRAEEAKREALGARLQALQARTNPHFLFNSLNTVASLIPTDPACAEATLERLAGLFRYSLDGARRTDVRLEDEIDAVVDYLNVESLRLGDRLTWKLEVEEGLGDLRIPPLTLQPLVENAILHGIAPRMDGGHVRITAGRRGEEVILSVVNDSPSAEAKRAAARRSGGTGTALADLERRLAIAYDDRATLDILRDGGCFQVDLTIPWDAAAEAAE